MVAAILDGSYQFSPCKQYENALVWCAQDALVLRAMAQVLSPYLNPQLSQHCFHLAGNGGAKGCVNAVSKMVDDYRCRSDVNSYYATIDHGILMKQLQALIPCETVLTLLGRMLDRLDDVQGVLHSVEIGISKGNPLSPLLGAVYLPALDQELGQYCEAHGYGRFMDDWVILCRTRQQLRAAVRIMNRVLDRVKMTKHPYKTFIGRIKESGFDFLGYRIGNRLRQGLDIAWKTWANHQGKLRQLYEQGVSETDIGQYVERWQRWVRSGVEVVNGWYERWTGELFLHGSNGILLNLIYPTFISSADY
ncbi:reverse transcriptase/maturase family protein [Candidatus Albibeggiatoa sp. nov. NOAA]|uniref:reverse transcriptase/maturase family protein n=1 Tax=Candidatus Albibeggiatoa sp. nov. NOAA TaxID=3162724 RepID=UPI0032F9E44C|nr:reverse transcriptase/maturase family protein [Thiotrichaceae bacterium]